MADADDQELSDLLQHVGEKSGWFDESGDITMVMQDLSIRVRHGSNKTPKANIANKSKTAKSTTKKPAKKTVPETSYNDFEADDVQKKKKPKKASFPFTSSEESVLTKPLRGKQAEDTENQPPNAVRSTRKKRNESGKKKAVLKKLMSFSSSDEEPSPTGSESAKLKRQEPSTPAALKEISSATKDKRRTPRGSPRTPVFQLFQTESSEQESVDMPGLETTRSAKKSRTPKITIVSKITISSSHSEESSIDMPGLETSSAKKPRTPKYPSATNALEPDSDDMPVLHTRAKTPARSTKKALLPKQPAICDIPALQTTPARIPLNPQEQAIILSPHVTTRRSQGSLRKSIKSRISYGQRGYETIIHSPAHTQNCRLSTNSNMSTMDEPIANSTTIDVSPLNPIDSYLARPVFQGITEQGSSGSSKQSREDKGGVITSQDLALQLTLTQADSGVVSTPKTSSSSIPSSEYRSRANLTQVPMIENDGDEDADRTVVSETVSESRESSKIVTDGPQVIEDSELSSKGKHSSESLFSNKMQDRPTHEKSSDRSSDKSMDASSGKSSSITSQNLSSFVKEKKKKSTEKSAKKFKHLLIQPDLSSDEEKEGQQAHIKDFNTLLTESKDILASIQSDESDIPATQKYGVKQHVYAPDSQMSVDCVPPSSGVYDSTHVSETDSSTKVVQESECSFVPDSQSLLIKDSQETQDTTGVVCIPESDVTNSADTQSTQDTVIRVPTQHEESSIDNPTTMFVKSKFRYVGETNQNESSDKSLRKGTTPTPRMATKTMQVSFSEHVEEAPVRSTPAGSVNLSQAVSSKRKGKRHIPMELVDSLDDPEDLQATIELLSQKLENILSAKAKGNKSILKKQKGSARKSADVDEEDNSFTLQGCKSKKQLKGSARKRTECDEEDNSFTLHGRTFSTGSDLNTPDAAQRSFDELHIHQRDTAAEERDTAAEERDTAAEERNTAAEERDTAAEESLIEEEIDDEFTNTKKPEMRCVSLQASMLDAVEEDSEDNDDKEDIEIEASGCNISLQCSMSSPPTEIEETGDKDELMTDNDDRDKWMTEDEKDDKDSLMTENEPSHDNLYRTVIGEDLATIAEQDIFTDDESFELRKNKKTPEQSPDNPFKGLNAVSIERVKTILSESNLRRRSTQVKGPRKVLSLSSSNSGVQIDEEDEADDDDDDDDDELPDIPNDQTPKSTGATWRRSVADDLGSSPELPMRSAAGRHRSESSSDDDDDDDNMEMFLSSMRTPAPKKKAADERSLDDFVVDDDDFTSDEEERDLFHVRVDNENKYKNLSIDVFTSDEEEDNTEIEPHYSSEDDIFAEKIPTKNTKKQDSSLFKTPSVPLVRKKHVSSVPGSRQPASTPDEDLLLSTPHRPPPATLSHTTGHAPQQQQQASFLCSLAQHMAGSKTRHKDAVKYIKGFSKLKEELTEHLFQLYNTTIFESKLPVDMEVKWNSRLLKTAGFCAYKKSKTTDGNRVVRIELSVKVCDSPERVRDTLIHEMCHAAVWIIHGMNDGHGPYWKHWAHKANRIHPDLPVIKRCHSYSIQTKYVYKCTSCGYEVGRHSKSLDTESKVCGYCRSPFQLLINSKKGQRSAPQTPATPRTPNAFALFMKENFKTIRAKNKDASHKDVMGMLSAEFAKTKLSK